MEYYSAIKKNTFESVLMRWMIEKKEFLCFYHTAEKSGELEPFWPLRVGNDPEVCLTPLSLIVFTLSENSSLPLLATVSTKEYYPPFSLLPVFTLLSVCLHL